MTNENTQSEIMFATNFFYMYLIMLFNRLRAAGAVLVAKLVSGSLAYDDIWFGGRTRNPWNIEEFSTGSSAGPAASTSAGILPKCLHFYFCISLFLSLPNPCNVYIGSSLEVFSIIWFIL